MMSGSIADLIASRRLLVFVGEGGVGKTSTAAAAALAAAAAGRDVAVLTVDPAPRLGDALGLGSFDEQPRRVEVCDRLPGGGSVVAMRLDTKRTFDRVVQRFAPGADGADAILDNPIYQTISGSLGGSESYMAFQRLHELTEEGDHDLLVVDTPPAVHAAELLSAPLRLDTLLDTRLVSILANPAQVVARAGSTVARATTAILVSVLERLTGAELHQQISAFVENFEHVLTGLSQQTRAIESLLRAPGTAFVEVVRPRPACVEAAVALERSLAQSRIAIEAVVVNRMTPPPGPDRTRSRRQRLEGAPTGTEAAVTRMEGDLDGLRAAEAGAVAMLRAGFARRPAHEQPAVVEVASLDHDVTSLDDVLRLGRCLQGATG